MKSGPLIHQPPNIQSQRAIKYLKYCSHPLDCAMVTHFQPFNIKSASLFFIPVSPVTAWNIINNNRFVPVAAPHQTVSSRKKWYVSLALHVAIIHFILLDGKAMLTFTVLFKLMRLSGVKHTCKIKTENLLTSISLFYSMQSTPLTNTVWLCVRLCAGHVSLWQHGQPWNPVTPVYRAQ